MQREQLPALDRLGVGRVVRLDVEQVPALAEERRRDDPGRLLVVRQEAWRARREPVLVVVRDLCQRVALGEVLEDLPEVMRSRRRPPGSARCRGRRP